MEHKSFLEGVIICCESASDFIQRYVVLAKEEAEKALNKQRKEELLEISNICDKISENIPTNLREALQLVWFNEVIGNISHGLGGIQAVGRPDQYLYPYYESDIKNNRIKNDIIARYQFCEL